MKLRLCFIKKLLLVLVSLLASIACNSGSNPISAPQFPDEANVEAHSFDLINEDRKAAGLSPLALDASLTAVARQHSADMRDRNYFGHIAPDGRTPANRLRLAGITFHVYGENIGRTTGIHDPAEAANKDFMGDKLHRDVLLNRDFTHVGVGVVRSGTEYWITQDFIGR